MEDDVTLDHIIPLTKGGDDSFENTQAAHGVCNWMKGNVPPDERKIRRKGRHGRRR